MLMKLKSAFIALSFLTVVGSFFSGSAVADPICGTLEECQSLRAYLQEELVQQESQVVRDFLQSQLTQVDARIEELLTGQPGGETRTTKTGHVFTRDRSHAALNEAWRDPDGLIWGDVVKNGDGSIRYMVQSSEYMKEIGRPMPPGALGAKEYCESIGARLPSKEEFTKLREYLGWGSSQGYSHHDNKILPNLSDHWFWSSSVVPHNPYAAYDFSGRGGSVGSIFARGNYFMVRCVVVR